MKTIVTETSLETKFWSVPIRTVAYFLWNGLYRNAVMPYFESFLVCSVDMEKRFKYFSNTFKYNLQKEWICCFLFLFAKHIILVIHLLLLILSIGELNLISAFNKYF